jgi:hypothetical protein
MSKYLIITLLSALALFSCSDGKTYAELLKAEERLINNYIRLNNIKVVKTFPAVWEENVYYKSSTGLYFHLVNAGDTQGDSIAADDLVLPRYLEITLTAKPDTLSDWNVIDSTYPKSFKFLDATSSAPEAWQEAVAYMKFNNARARFIVHSKIGFTDAESSVTPYLYDMRIKFQK